MSWLGDIFSFEKFNLEEMLKKAKKNPEQLLLGAADPLSAKAWGGITGKEYTPIVNQWGGASDDTYDKAEAAGINTGPGRQAHNVAQAVASIYAGGAAMGALGGGGSAAANGASAVNSVGPLSSGYAMPATAANSVGPMASGYGYGNLGFYGSQAPGAQAVLANGAPVMAGGSSGGMDFGRFADMLKQMQGTGGQQQSEPPPMTPGQRQSMGQISKFADVYKGETDYTTKRKKKRRGLLED